MLPNTISEQVRLFLIKHVRLERAPPELKFSGIVMTPLGPQVVEQPFIAGTMLTNEGYRMLLGGGYFDASPEMQKTILLHEIAHILRGDCLIRDETLDHRLLNMAQDSLINEHLNHEHVSSLHGVIYHELAEKLDNPELPKTYLPSTKKIYNALLKKQKEEEKECDCGSGWGCVQKSPEGTGLGGRIKHVKAVLDSKDIEGEIPGGRGYSINLKSEKKSISFKERALPLLSVIINRLRGISNLGLRKRARTFVREGRNPFLRGAHDLPRLKLLVALDGSGSCVPYYQKLGAVAKWLARKHSIDLAAFDTGIEFYRSIGSLKVSGGGTCFQPVWRAAVERKCDAVIILTDGEAGDIKPLPPMSVVWVMTPGGSKPPLRKGIDTSVDLSKDEN